MWTARAEGRPDSTDRTLATLTGAEEEAPACQTETGETVASNSLLALTFFISRRDRSPMMGDFGRSTFEAIADFARRQGGGRGGGGGGGRGREDSRDRETK